jgi:hypothetical protein
MGCLIASRFPFPKSPAPYRGRREISGKTEGRNFPFREFSGIFGSE